MSQMKFIASVLIYTAVAAASAAPIDSTKENATKRRTSCNEYFNMFAAVITSQDWNELDHLGERYNKNCIGVFGNEEDTAGYMEIAEANVELGNFKKALSASEACVRIFYTRSTCHIARVQALIGLKNMSAAKMALGQSERLIEHLKQLARQDLESPKSAAMREDALSLLNLLTAQTSLALSLRQRYFAD